VSNPLVDIFPTGRTGIESQARTPLHCREDELIDAKLQTIMSTMKPRRPISDEESMNVEHDILRPGSSYPIYRSISSLPETGRLFYESAARLVGLSLQSVVRAVLHTELKLQQWQEGKRRTEFQGEKFAWENLSNHFTQVKMDDMDDTDDMEEMILSDEKQGIE
jgi:RNA polymerase I-specific transcription initiation factor RRN7